MGETAAPATEDKSEAPVVKADKPMVIRPGDAQMKPVDQRKGMSFTRFCAALALAKGNVSQAAEIAVKWKDSSPEVLNVLKYAGQRGGTLGLAEDAIQRKTAVAAGDTTTTAWAGALVQYDNMASEFVEYLRPQTIIGKLTGLRRVPFNIRFPSQSAGSSVGWVGQGLPKKVSKLTLATNTLGFAKAAGIVVITKELAMFSSPSAETLVRDDLAASMIAFLDQQFIDPGVAASANVSPASITNGLTSQNQATGTTLATFEADVATAMSVLIAGEVPFTSAVWVTDPYTAMKIGMLRTANGDYAYPGVGVNGGTLFGIPLITSNGVPHSVSAGSILTLFSQPDIFLADEGGLEVDASDQASIEMNDAPAGGATSLTSLWQNNLIGIRCERVINWQRRRTAAVTYIDNLHL
jgi:HK97 family phage major capsid protein